MRLPDYTKKQYVLIALVIFVGVCMDGGILYSLHHKKVEDTITSSDLSGDNDSTQSTQEQASSSSSGSGSKSSSTASNTKTPKQYVAGVCTKTPIARSTNYVYLSDLYPEQGYTGVEGYDGYTQTCTADSAGRTIPPSTSPPADKKVYVGTKQHTTTPPAPPSSGGVSYQSALAICSRASDSSAYEPCMHAYGY